MTYETYDQSVEDSSPVELFLFTQGVESYAYCAGDVDVTYLSYLFRSSQIKRERIVQSDDIFKDGCKLTFARDHEFASTFTSYVPDQVTSVTIYRGHLTDPDNDFSVVWKGRVINGRPDDNKIVLECESLYSTMRNPGLRAGYEYTCRHLLYGVKCGVSAVLYRTATIISSFDTAIDLIVPGASAHADGYYTGGILVTDTGARRFIISHAGSSIKISRPLSNTDAGQSVEIYAGCDHVHSTCVNKFGNHLNFGGFKDIPTKNIFKLTSLV